MDTTFDESMCEVTENVKNDIIKPINRETVHRICSGQVVLSLAIAMKELIENSIDAGAKNIEVKLKDYGQELVEVIDNGSGVRKENFSALTLKHYTSKIKEFNDLESVATLGFRGEALSSLCALSDLTVITRHSSMDHGTKIQYDHNGKIVSETPVARSPGTTVQLSNLFSSLPVRRKEFTKNHKREFNKMCTLLYAYCLVSKGVKFTCTNQTSKGSSNSIVSTPGVNSIKDNIISIFGPKQISTLIELELIKPDETLLQEFGIKSSTDEESPFEFEAFISSVIHGSGRSSSDRQFYYINSRPCEPVKVSKLVNEIYRQYNPNQYPFVFLNVRVKTSLVDVNVTPDKRQIFLEKEKLLLATVKSSLIEAFKNFPSTYKLQNTSLSVEVGKKRALDASANGSIIDMFRKKPRGDDGGEKKESPQFSLEDFQFKVEKRKNTIDHLPLPNCKPELSSISLITSTNRTLDLSNLDDSQDVIELNGGDLMDSNSELKEINLSSEKEKYQSKIKLGDASSSLNEVTEITSENLMDVTFEETIACRVIPTPKKKSNATTKDDVKEISSGTYRRHRKHIPLDVSLSDIQLSIQSVALKNDQKKQLSIKFRTEISPSSNEKAEAELQKQISKDLFERMKIIGQFNYAFIIASLDRDLFIIDQHATDEKYNFEELQRTTVLESQPLVSPKDLQLTAANEIVLIENLEIFKKNGFHFMIDESAEATKKVKLTKIPVSKSYIFGKDDIEEMLYMLQEGFNDSNCRPTRVRGMFASRACRKSVMVGKPLSKVDMRRLVDHMGQIDQPWNCPHGRPTMRHLINLDLLHKN